MPQSQPDGKFYLPPSGKGPGVLVLHPWWGLNDTIQAYSKRLADAGFVVFAADLFHGKVAKTIPEAQALANSVEADADKVKADVAQAATFLAEHAAQPNNLGIVAFSLGGYFAVNHSCVDPEHIRSVVLYYGSGDGDLE